jgi:hypothetical protein
LVEDVRRKDGAGYRLVPVLLRGHVTRATVAHAEFDPLGAPLRGSAAFPPWTPIPIDPLDGDMTVLLLRLEAMESFTAWPKDVAELSRIAFTLSVTLQDLLGSLFPGMAHRFAVVSPQAAPVIEFGRDAAQVDPRANFLTRRHPCIVTPEEVMAPTAAPANMQATMADIAACIRLAEARLMPRRHDGIVSPSRQAEAPATHLLDFLIIEDSDHDLGALRAVIGPQDLQLLTRWADFATWAAGAKDARGFHYGAGQTQSDALDFAGASRLLQAIMSGAAGAAPRV